MLRYSKVADLIHLSYAFRKHQSGQAWTKGGKGRNISHLIIN